MASEPLIGSIFLFAGNFAPRGYASCNGALLSISQNAALFSILGTTFGGNGTTTFGLPDLQGRSPIGAGSGAGLSPVQLGEKAGSQTVTLTSANVPAHNHPLLAAAGTGTVATPTGNALAATGDGQGGSLPSFATTAPNQAMAAASIGANAGGGTPVGIRNPYLGVTYIIATEGIYPSRN